MDDSGNENQAVTFQTSMRLIAKSEAERVIMQHLALCPFATEQVGHRLRTLEISYARLIGFMAGSGLIGGTAGAAIVKAIGG